MDFHSRYSQEDEAEFGPGTALVLSLFAVLLLIAAMSWASGNTNGSRLPSRVLAITEGGGGQSLFKTGRYDLTAEARTKIATVAEQLVQAAQSQYSQRKSGPNHIQVIGYASPEGKDNAPLAQNRAKAVRDYLVALGIPDECIILGSYSDSHSASLGRWLTKGNTSQSFRRLSPNEQRKALSVTEAELAQERRVEILSVYHSDSVCRLDLVKLIR